MAALVPGTRARVRVPATSANLGPGFDCLGMALSLRDELWAKVIPHGLEFELSGEGADSVPRDETHLVVRVLRTALADLGAELPGLRLGAHNVIPHGRGLGSSAAAIVGGLALAWAMARPGVPLDRDWACDWAARLEGHPDNACAAVLGGVVLAWSDDDEALGVVSLPVVDGLRAVAWVPSFEVATASARSVLPDRVTRADAVVQATSSAVLVHALTHEPGLLLRGTQDLLHQPYRGRLMEPSASLVQRLRAAGVPAVISGAGPTVLALGTAAQLQAVDGVAADGFRRHDLEVGCGVQLLPVAGA